MAYRTYTDPAQQYQGSAFNPMTGRLDGGQLVMQFMNRMMAEKQRKQEEQWGIEDRDLQKRLTEAQISNYMETTPPKPVAPISNVTSAQVKALMKRLSYPQEAIDEVDTMNDVARKETWAKLQDHFKQITTSGGKVPATAATARGRLQQARLKAALDTVKSRKTFISGGLTQLYSDPEKAMLGAELITKLRAELEAIERQEGEIASMMNNIDESGELTEQQFAQLNTILKFGRSLGDKPRSAAWGTPGQTATDGVMETKVIDGQTLYKWESDKQWHPNKPTPTKK